MNNQELLELAAKAAGYQSETVNGRVFLLHHRNAARCEWNPLTDDGDALRLAVKLDMVVSCAFAEDVDDPYAATRLAIVKSAVEHLEKYSMRNQDNSEMAAIVAEKDERITQLQTDVNALRAFSNKIISASFEDEGVWGGDVQDWGLEYGLLRIEKRESECGEYCNCRQYGFPSECCQKTDLLTPEVLPKND